MDTIQKTTGNGHAKFIDTENVVIRFSGDSGDGMQLTGTQFSDTSAFFGNDICTFPDYPSEIRAPSGTIAGVSGFQIQFGSKEICTPGDTYDVLVAMNAAALKVELKNLKKGGIIIVNSAGFDKKSLKLAQYPEDINPLTDGSLSNYQVFNIDISQCTKESLSDLGMTNKDIERSKNMFVLGLLYWMFDKSTEHTESFINEKFANKPSIAESNIRVLKVGWNYGENTEIFTNRFKVAPASLPKGNYRSITGNHASAIALVAASEKSGLPLYLGSYPITPASDILHDLSGYKSNNVKTFQAEDEIGGICAAIGASYAGNLAVTTTSGPGFSLKVEALGLATILEIPLVVINVQRGGPSTGMPTKTEQADLLQAMYSRHGEAPLPVIASSSPSDCFDAVYEACRIAVEHMTPVICLTDGYIANGSEPWKFPQNDDLKPININFMTRESWGDTDFLPYKRDEKLSRPWTKPGTKGLEHRIGGLEKKHETGDPCHDAENHEFMVKLRQAKIDKIAEYIPEQKVSLGKAYGNLAILTWGSTFGTVRNAVSELLKSGHEVSHIHLRYLNPFPKNLEILLKQFNQILIPEMNNGQLSKLIRAEYLIPAISLNKIKGIPFSTDEIKDKALEMLNQTAEKLILNTTS
jgi:2-oxoglutarate/2-oxoacid ferredoxin oxidoreductase subunit alpha